VASVPPDVPVYELDFWRRASEVGRIPYAGGDLDEWVCGPDGHALAVNRNLLIGRKRYRRDFPPAPPGVARLAEECSDAELLGRASVLDLTGWFFARAPAAENGAHRGQFRHPVEVYGIDVDARLVALALEVLAPLEVELRLRHVERATPPAFKATHALLLDGDRAFALVGPLTPPASALADADVFPPRYAPLGGS